MVAVFCKLRKLHFILQFEGGNQRIILWNIFKIKCSVFGVVFCCGWVENFGGKFWPKVWCLIWMMNRAFSEEKQTPTISDAAPPQHRTSQWRFCKIPLDVPYPFCKLWIFYIHQNFTLTFIQVSENFTVEEVQKFNWFWLNSLYLFFFLFDWICPLSGGHFCCMKTSTLIYVH